MIFIKLIQIAKLAIPNCRYLHDEQLFYIIVSLLQKRLYLDEIERLAIIS